MKLRSLCGLSVMIAFSGDLAWAGTSFHNLGSGLAPNAVSADGSVVAGTTPDNYAIWTEKEGIASIGGVLPGAGVGGQARISDDGDRICATVFNDKSGFHEMGYFDVNTGVWTPLGGIGGSSGTEISSSWGISGDGTSVVGLGWVSGGCAHATQWIEGMGTMDLGSTVPDRSSRANGTNIDGSVVVGWQDASTGFRQGAVWVDGVQTIITDGGGSALREAQDVSADGVFVTGIANGNQAWRWDADNGAEFLGVFATPFTPTTASGTGITADGSTIVGAVWPFGPAIFGRGFIWRDGVGIQDIGEFFADQGVPFPPGFVFNFPTDISSDGTTIVGNGMAGGGPPVVGWVVRLGVEGVAGDCDGDGDVDLADFGEFQLCFSGPDGGPVSEECGCADFDDDGDVDLVDFNAFQLAFTGPL